jgi:hypothetical protein
MSSSGFWVWRPLIITTLCLALLAGLPGAGKAVQPLRPPLYVPKAFRQMEAEVTAMRFFATPTSEAISMQARVYKTNFLNTDTKYIWWEMSLKTKVKLDRPVTMYLWVTWQRADGSEANQSLVFTIPPNFLNPCLAGRWQDNRPGGWLPGAYRVTIQIDDIQVASGSFEVFKKVFNEK